MDFPLRKYFSSDKYSGALLLSFLPSALGRPVAPVIWETGIWVNSHSRTILNYCHFQFQIFPWALQSVNRDFRARKAGTSSKYWPSFFHVLLFPCQIPLVYSAKTPWPCCGNTTTMKVSGKFSPLLGQDFSRGLRSRWQEGSGRMKWESGAGRAWCTAPGAEQLGADSSDTYPHISGAAEAKAGAFLAAAVWISRTEP